ncbi:MAG: helix-turn-helix domain-containing protein [Candidatus Wallbacteria bacterium]
MKSIKKRDVSRIERKKEECRSKIIDTAVALFSKKGIDGTTMEEIAETADFAKGTLYNYFPSKEIIIDEFIKRSFKRKNADRIIKMKSLPDTVSRMKAMFTELISGIGTQRELFEKYIVSRMKAMISFRQRESAKSGMYELTGEIIRLGIEAGEIRSDLPLWSVVDFFEFCFIEAVKEFYFSRDDFDISYTVEKYVGLFMSGMRPL